MSQRVVLQRLGPINRPSRLPAGCTGSFVSLWWPSDSGLLGFIEPLTPGVSSVHPGELAHEERERRGSEARAGAVRDHARALGLCPAVNRLPCGAKHPLVPLVPGSSSPANYSWFRESTNWRRVTLFALMSGVFPRAQRTL